MNFKKEILTLNWCNTTAEFFGLSLQNQVKTIANNV